MHPCLNINNSKALRLVIYQSGLNGIKNRKRHETHVNQGDNVRNPTMRDSIISQIQRNYVRGIAQSLTKYWMQKRSFENKYWRTVWNRSFFNINVTTIQTNFKVKTPWLIYSSSVIPGVCNIGFIVSWFGFFITIRKTTSMVFSSSNKSCFVHFNRMCFSSYHLTSIVYWHCTCWTNHI